MYTPAQHYVAACLTLEAAAKLAQQPHKTEEEAEATKLVIEMSLATAQVHATLATVDHHTTATTAQAIYRTMQEEAARSKQAAEDPYLDHARPVTSS